MGEVAETLGIAVPDQAVWQRIGDAVWRHAKIARNGRWRNTMAVRLTTGGLAIISLTARLGEAAYRNWVLDQLEKSPPTRLAMCHGELASGPGMGETLIDLVRRKL